MKWNNGKSCLMEKEKNCWSGEDINWWAFFRAKCSVAIPPTVVNSCVETEITSEIERQRPHLRHNVRSPLLSFPFFALVARFSFSFLSFGRRGIKPILWENTIIVAIYGHRKRPRCFFLNSLIFYENAAWLGQKWRNHAKPRDDFFFQPASNCHSFLFVFIQNSCGLLLMST